MLHYYILKQDYWSPKLLSYLNLQKCIALEKKKQYVICVNVTLTFRTMKVDIICALQGK